MLKILLHDFVGLGRGDDIENEMGGASSAHG